MDASAARRPPQDCVCGIVSERSDDGSLRFFKQPCHSSFEASRLLSTLYGSLNQTPFPSLYIAAVSETL